MLTQGAERRLGKRALIILCLEKSKIGLVLFVITFAMLLFKSDFPLSVQGVMSTIINYFSLVTLVALAISFGLGWLDYANYSFTLEEFDIRMKRGLAKKIETSIPYRQIQDVNIERNPMDQLFGLSKLIIRTAGHEETGEKNLSEITIEAMDKELAEEIRNALQGKIGIQIVKPDTTSTTEII